MGHHCTAQLPDSECRCWCPKVQNLPFPEPDNLGKMREVGEILSRFVVYVEKWGHCYEKCPGRLLLGGQVAKGVVMWRKSGRKCGKGGEIGEHGWHVVGTWCC